MKHIILCAAVAIGASTTARAEQDCSKALIEDTEMSTYNKTSDYAYAYSMSKETYSKKSSGIGIGFPLYGVPVKASWDEYHEDAKKKAVSIGMKDFENVATSYVTSSLKGNARDAYIACIQSSQSGVYVGLKSAASGYYIVSINSNPPPDTVIDSIKVFIAPNIKSDDVSRMNEMLSGATSKSFQEEFILRPDDTSVAAAINVKIGNRSFVIPLHALRRVAMCNDGASYQLKYNGSTNPPRFEQDMAENEGGKIDPSPCLPIDKKRDGGTPIGDENSFTSKECFVADQGWELVPDSLDFTAESDKKCSTFTGIVASKEKACGNVTLTVQKGGQPCFVQWKHSVKAVSDN